MRSVMQLMINISKEVYEHILKAKSVPDVLGIDIVNAINAVKNGTPLNDTLEKISAEITQVANQEKFHDEKWALGLRYAANIIDKYKAEGGSDE